MYNILTVERIESIADLNNNIIEDLQVGNIEFKINQRISFCILS